MPSIISEKHDREFTKLLNLHERVKSESMEYADQLMQKVDLVSKDMLEVDGQSISRNEALESVIVDLRNVIIDTMQTLKKENLLTDPEPLYKHLYKEWQMSFGFTKRALKYFKGRGGLGVVDIKTIERLSAYSY